MMMTFLVLCLFFSPFAFRVCWLLLLWDARRRCRGGPGVAKREGDEISTRSLLKHVRGTYRGPKRFSRCLSCVGSVVALSRKGGMVSSRIIKASSNEDASPPPGDLSSVRVC